MHQQLGLRYLGRDQEVAGRLFQRGFRYLYRFAFPVGSRLFQFPLFLCLPVSLFFPLRLDLDQRSIPVGQAAHIVDTPFAVGCRSYLDGKEVGIDAFFVIHAPDPRQTGTGYGAGCQQGHVAFARIGIETNGLTQERRQMVCQVGGQERGRFA